MVKRLLSFAAGLALCLPMMSQAVIKFEKTVIDFGKFPESKAQTCEFVFKNTGDKPLVIQQAYGSCGCTVPSVPKDPIAPGAKGVIKVTYNGKGQFLGFFKKLVTVRSNATNAIVRVYIQGTLQEG